MKFLRNVRTQNVWCTQIFKKMVIVKSYGNGSIIERRRLKQKFHNIIKKKDNDDEIKTNDENNATRSQREKYERKKRRRKMYTRWTKENIEKKNNVRYSFFIFSSRPMHSTRTNRATTMRFRFDANNRGFAILSNNHHRYRCWRKNRIRPMKSHRRVLKMKIANLSTFQHFLFI